MRFPDEQLLLQYQLVEFIQSYDPEVSELLLNKAYVYAMQKHSMSGPRYRDPYFENPLSVAMKLADLRASSHLVAAGLIFGSSVVDKDRPEIEQLFGAEIAAIIHRACEIRDRIAGENPDALECSRILLAASLAGTGISPALSVPPRVLNQISPVNRTLIVPERLKQDPVFLAEQADFDYARQIDLVGQIASNYELIHKLSPRAFEEFVADLLLRRGYATSLTKQTRDGGYDILATRKDGIISTVYVVECKKYASENKVSVELVRQLYGVVSLRNASGGMLFTTSSFTRPAIDFAGAVDNRLSLIDALRIKHLIGVS